MRILTLLISSLLLLALSGLTGAAEYPPWSDKVFSYIEKTYGPEAGKRMRYLHGIVRANQNIGVEEKLRLVNDTMNKLPWIADKSHWGKTDYWASPLEALTTFGGDCEDIAIAKWIMLWHLGLPPEKLRLVYVKIKATGESHMVFAYVDRIDLPREERLESTWILDNIDKRLLKAKQRTDLLAIYATDADGNLVMFKDSADGAKIQGVFEKSKMARLNELKVRIKENMAKLAEINDGRPLHPH